MDELELREESLALPQREEVNVNARYWCYTCSKEVLSSVAEGCQDNMELLCSECGNGFIEAITTAESSSIVHQAQWIPGHNGDAGGGREEEEDEIQRLDRVDARLLQHLLGTVPHNNGENDWRDTENSHGVMGNDIEFSHDAQDGEQNLVIGQQDMGYGDDEDGETGRVITIPVGPDEWDSSEDDENDNEEDWEEEEEDRDEISERTSMAENADEEFRSQTEIQTTRWRLRDTTGLQPRIMNDEHDLHHYLQQIFENLSGNNLELRVEFPEGPLYVGNPGDYLDARGFEQLLLHLAETDNSRRGAPPAAKSAVENLPSIIVDGSPVCAICKDAIIEGGVAKQLPCLHLYHHDCILPWLSTRNSCPICRYELPTDDAEYEEQKGNASYRAHATNNTNLHVQSNSQEPSSEGLPHMNFNLQNSSQELSFEWSPHATFNLQNRSQALSSGQFSNTEVENVFLEGNVDTENVSAGTQDLGRQIAPESELEIDRGEANNEEQELELLDLEEHDSEPNHENRYSEPESTRTVISQTLGSRWFLMAAGPVISVVGLVLVLFSFGTNSIGGKIRQHIQWWGGQHHDSLRVTQIQQAGMLNKIHSRRRWWMPFRR